MAHSQLWRTVVQTEVVTNPSKKRGGKIAVKNTAAAKISAPIAASEYLTTREAAAYLKLSRQFLEGARYRGDGSGPAYIKLERAVRYRRNVLDAWMSAHDHSPDKPIQSK
jgi:Helix-turn-helix domain